MKKIKVAVFFGGRSPEYRVSLESAYSVLRNLDSEKYEPVPIGITNTGKWYYFAGNIEKIKLDKWENDVDCIRAVLSPDYDARKLLLLRGAAVEEISIDAALPILHGQNGEDGTVQGTIELSGIPLAGCGILASALCMDKDRAHKLVGAAGVRVPKSIVLRSCTDTAQAQSFAIETGFPLFIKPVKAGSSYGITKVYEADELIPAVTTAFRYDNEVILEENINGFEVGCAVLGTDRLITGEVDEIELSQGFFDFTEKYTLKTSAIHVPARISAEKAAQVKETAKLIYRTLGCSGFARVDMFLTPAGEIVFNEVNTIPGFTEHSRYPGMMKAAGLSFRDILDRIIEQAVAQ